jgi:ABC-type polysaccharide/polyol phosphate export permease
MLWNLLVKDLSRARRNPWPYLINLALPLCITGLIGLAFGPSSQGGGLGRIKIAIVDEDDSVLSRFLRGATSQGDAAKHLEARFFDKEKAIQQINGNEISAVLIIPKGFTRTYLNGPGPVALELIKNPAQSIYPAIVEEFLSVVVTGLNAISRNLQSDFPEWLRVLEKEGRPDLAAVSRLLTRIGGKFEQAEKYLFPPLVTYAKETRQKEQEAGPAFNIFAYLLPGMAAMFLMMLADHSIRDLYREMEVHTFDRFRTIHHRLTPFISSKVILSMTNVLLGSAILFLGGGSVFRVHWQQPLPMALVILAFGLFASGFMALIAAVAQSERRANVLNNSIVLIMAFVGGGFFPARQLPAFLRDYVSPLMPNYWFIETIRSLQGIEGQMSWMMNAARLSLLGLALVALAAWIFQRSLSKGVRA